MTGKIIFGGVFFLALFSCRTHDMSPDRLFLKKIENPGSHSDSFEYSGQRLVTFKRFFGDREDTNTQFYYQGNRLTKIEVKREYSLERIELAYGENGMRREEKLTATYYDTTTVIQTGTFSYKDGILASIKYTFNDPNYMTRETLFDWQKGNIVKMEYYIYNGDNKNLYGYKTMVYDDKRNYSNQDIAFIYTSGIGLETLVSKNNVIATIENYGDTIFDGGSYKFTYNSRGYPNGYTFKVNSWEDVPFEMIYE